MLGDIWVLCCLLLSLEHCSGWMGSVGIGKLHAGHCPDLFIVLVVCACVRACVRACVCACVRVLDHWMSCCLACVCMYM